MARSDHDKLFADDGRKLHDTERVGAMSPDTDAPDTEPSVSSAARRPPERPRSRR